MSPDIETVKALLWTLHQAQQTVWAWLGALGLTPSQHGQTVWPFGQRLAAEQLLFDGGQAGRLLVSGGAVGVALALLLVSLCWRRARWPFRGGAVLLLVFAPWPQWSLLTVPTVPTAFHRSPTGFTAASILEGQRLYGAHCQRCHGDDGSGEGPDAARLAMWPPTLNGSLLWKRTEGELFWHVRHGMQDRAGKLTMPAASAALGDAQLWALLDFLRAQAAGQTLRKTGAWSFPVRLPDAPLRCRDTASSLRALQGQRVRLALTQGDTQALGDDPRLATVAVGPGASPVDCHSDDAALEAALAVLIGVTPKALPGHRLIADRQGWLRVRGRPGADWSADDLVCRASTPPAQGVAGAATADGLDGLIRRMDREPVRQVSGGFPH